MSPDDPEPAMTPETATFSGPYVIRKASTRERRHQSFGAAEAEARRLVEQTGEPFRILQERGLTRMKPVYSPGDEPAETMRRSTS